MTKRANKRCPRCKKIRKIFMRRMRSGRVSSMNVPGEGKVCWICRIREFQPDWRPGMPLPVQSPLLRQWKHVAREEIEVSEVMES